MMYSHRPTLQPVVPCYHASILNDEQLERLRSAAPGILVEASIRRASDTAMHVSGEQGAQMDPESQHVTWSPAIVLATSLARRVSNRGRSLARTRYSVDGTSFFCAAEAAGPGLLTQSRRRGKRPTGSWRITILSHRKKPAVQHPYGESVRWSGRRGRGWPAVMHSARRQEA
jgi:trimethylamine:corrinoid methyltransferase-like protein